MKIYNDNIAEWWARQKEASHISRRQRVSLVIRWDSEGLPYGRVEDCETLADLMVTQSYDDPSEVCDAAMDWLCENLLDNTNAI